MIIHKYQSSLSSKLLCDLNFKIKSAKVIVTITESPENKGPCLYGLYETLATEIYYKFLRETPTEDIIWIEHYPAYPETKETFARVFMYWNNGAFMKPRRRRLKKKKIGNDRVEMEMDTIREAMACYGTGLWNTAYLIGSLERLLTILKARRGKGKRKTG